MRTLIQNVVYTFFSVFFLVPAPVMAATERVEMMIESQEQSAGALAAHRLLGHLTLARQSIDLKMGPSALSHLAMAKAEAEMIIKHEIETKDVKLPFGKFLYSMGDVQRDYYYPVWSGEGFAEDVAAEQWGKTTRAEIKDLTIVQAVVRLDLKGTVGLIDQATAELNKKNKDFMKASAKLDDIYKGALVSEFVVYDPLLALWGDMVLAREFTKAGDYKGAKYSLGRARKGLKSLEKREEIVKNAAEAKVLHQEMEALEKTLKEKSPSAWAKAKMKTREWTAKVRSWI